MALLSNLIHRCDLLAVDAGRLVLRPKNGDQALADAWLSNHYRDVLTEILSATNRQAVEFVSYDTGHYGRHRAPGVTLQFSDIATGTAYYCCFNARLTRARTTRHGKQGAALPKGQFRPPDKGAFTAFWLRVGLPLPRRLSEFHTCMGKLGAFAMDATIEAHSKVNKQDIGLLNITGEEIKRAILCGSVRQANIRQGVDKEPTTSRQLADKEPARPADKDTDQTLTARGLQSVLSTCGKDHGNKVKGNTVKADKLFPATCLKGELSGQQMRDPAKQSHDEWLSDYESANQIATPFH